MEITSTNADAIISLLFAWRTKAAAAGRDEDADVLGALMGYLRNNYPVATALERRLEKVSPRVGTSVTADAAKCCPYAGQKALGCVPCNIDKDRLFTVPENPNTVYACALKWSEAIRGRDTSFIPK